MWQNFSFFFFLFNQVFPPANQKFKRSVKSKTLFLHVVAEFVRIALHLIFILRTFGMSAPLSYHLSPGSTRNFASSKQIRVILQDLVGGSIERNS